MLTYSKVAATIGENLLFPGLVLIVIANLHIFQNGLFYWSGVPHLSVAPVASHTAASGILCSKYAFAGETRLQEDYTKKSVLMYPIATCSCVDRRKTVPKQVRDETSDCNEVEKR